jgi:hypothetical protein
VAKRMPPDLRVEKKPRFVLVGAHILVQQLLLCLEFGTRTGSGMGYTGLYSMILHAANGGPCVCRLGSERLGCVPPGNAHHSCGLRGCAERGLTPEATSSNRLHQKSCRIELSAHIKPKKVPFGRHSNKLAEIARDSTRTVLACTSTSTTGTATSLRRW